MASACTAVDLSALRSPRAHRLVRVVQAVRHRTESETTMTSEWYSGGGPPEGKGLGYHPKKKRSKWELDYDAADWRVILTCVGVFLFACLVIGAVISAAYALLT